MAKGENVLLKPENAAKCEAVRKLLRQQKEVVLASLSQLRRNGCISDDAG